MVTPNEIKLFIESMKKVSTYDFSDYSEKSFTRRIEKILSDYKLTLPGLITKIQKESDFREKIVNDITVNTTELFRDPGVWQSIKYRLLPKILDKDEINIWHAGCSTGQEIYSMAILLNEYGILERTNIFATDLNTEVINAAKTGKYVYRFNIEYLENFKQVVRQNPYNFDEYNDVPFEKYMKIDTQNDSIEMLPFLRNNVYFKRHDLVHENNVFYRKFDIILCRNVMIYFNTKLQNRLFSLFNDSLVKKGHLVLGLHETILGSEALKYIKYGNFYIKKSI
jgi:chemotaxis protein methyltransferase CheR